MQLDSANSTCHVSSLLGSHCEYYIALYGADGDASFSITAEVDEGFSDPTRLDDGSPIADSVAR